MELIGLDECLAAVSAEIKAIRAQEAKAVSNAGHAYQHDVQNLAPVDTGQYRASIRTDPVEWDMWGNPFVRIGTDKPQACRLEFGFFGMTDRLGRMFYQMPRPHFRPPLDLRMNMYIDIMHENLASYSRDRVLFDYTNYFDSSRITDEVLG